jgi:hypothetical protein
MHSPRVELHHKEHIVRHQALPHGNLNREEICCGQNLPGQFQELSLAQAGLALSEGGIYMVTA